MAVARTRAVALTGVRAHLVEVEAVLGQGLPGLAFTGLADTSVVESRDRVRAAVHSCGAAWPDRKVTVALLPADLRKVGSRFDLAVAVAVLAATAVVPADAVRDTVWIAELGLDGRLRPVRGVLPALTAIRDQARQVVVAPGNGAEAALVPGVDVRVAHDLAEIVTSLRREAPPWPAPKPSRTTTRDDSNRIWPRSRGRRWASAPSRWRRPADTTCSWRARPAPARPCWRSACRDCCRRSTTTRRSRSPPSTRWQGCSASAPA
jgi:magnesium chelatase family protein